VALRVASGLFPLATAQPTHPKPVSAPPALATLSPRSERVMQQIIHFSVAAFSTAALSNADLPAVSAKPG